MWCRQSASVCPLLSWRALHCPRKRISGLPLERKKHPVAFPVISAAAGAAALCKACPDCRAGESHLQSRCVPALTWCRQGCQADLQSHAGAVCCVRQSCPALQGWAAHVPSHECIRAAHTCSQLQQHEGWAPLNPPELRIPLLPTSGKARDPGAASHLNGADSRGKGQGMEINAPASVSSCPLAGLFYSGSLNMYILLHALLQY